MLLCILVRLVIYKILLVGNGLQLDKWSDLVEFNLHRIYISIPISIRISRLFNPIWNNYE